MKVWSWMGDDKHRKEIMKFWGFGEETKAAVDMQTRVKAEDELNDKTELDKNASKLFRGMAARVNYMGQDRPDLQYAARDVCTEMAKPTVAGMAKLKKVARYLVGAEKLVWKVGQWEEDEDPMIEVFVDSDWAKAEDRRSISGGILVVGKVAVKHWSRTQATRALSSGEAEYAALVTGCAEGLGLQGLMKDLGVDWRIRVWSDSSAARAIAGRRGLGKCDTWSYGYYGYKT